MTTYLLDANVLISLTVAEHEHHERVAAWSARVDRVALCPIVEGALIRFLVRIGEDARAAAQVLRRMHADPRCELWSDAIGYSEVDLDHVRGHRQVTDAYLASLADAHDDAILATLDHGLVHDRPGSAMLVPHLDGSETARSG